MTWLLLGLLIGIVGVGWFGFERQRQVYEQLVGVIATDRDAARNEAKVFRGLLFPSLNKTEALSMVVDDLPKAVIPRLSTNPPTATSAPPVARSRVPFRLRFNQARKTMNTPQQKTDALASALAKQKLPQEKTHVS